MKMYIDNKCQDSIPELYRIDEDEKEYFSVRNSLYDATDPKTVLSLWREKGLKLEKYSGQYDECLSAFSSDIGFKILQAYAIVDTDYASLLDAINADKKTVEQIVFVLKTSEYAYLTRMNTGYLTEDGYIRHIRPNAISIS
jgi:hypothetical protein